MCVLSVSPTCLSFDRELQILACLQHYMGSEHVILTCGLAQDRSGLPGEHHGVGVPPDETWGQMAETWTPPAATHRQKTVLQLRVEDQDHVRQRTVWGQCHLQWNNFVFNWPVYLTSPLNLSKHINMYDLTTFYSI